MTMDARKQRVLQAIVALYGLEGEPVGSSVLANYFDMAVSSATLRNEMAALTKLGLLEQPHTSAGRVPSAKGYRYYLDNLLTDDQPLDRVSRARVDAVFASLDHEPEKLAQGAARALAAISGCTAAISTPCAEDLCIAHYEVVQVGRSAAAVLAVTTAGYVRTRVARVRTGFVFFFPAKHGFAIFYTEWPSINVTACLTSKPLISRFSNKSIINFTAVRPFSVTS